MFGLFSETLIWVGFPIFSPTDVNNYANHNIAHDWRLLCFSSHKGGYSEIAAFDLVAY